MTLPAYMQEEFGAATGFALMTIVGFFFGFVLERAGFGRATVLTAQFYLRDMRVLKVMFTAVATAALGLGLLAGVGLLDLSLVVVPEAYLAPQIVGGLLVGAGFVLSGYCPGTSVVAAASGNRDGAIAWLGIVVGSLLFGLAFPLLEAFYDSTPIAEIRFPELLGIPMPLLAAGVLVMAVGAFVGGEKVEAIFARKDGVAPPSGTARVRNLSFGVLGLVAVLGLVTLAFPSGERTAPPAPAGRRIGALDLARAIVQQSPPLYLVDVREPSACGEGTIPGAICLSEDDPAADFLADLPATRSLVLFGDGTLERLPAAAASYGGEVLVVDGGFAAFREEILAPPGDPADTSPEGIARHRLRGALHGHFTGARVSDRPAPARPKTIRRAVKKGGGC